MLYNDLLYNTLLYNDLLDHLLLDQVALLYAGLLPKQQSIGGNKGAGSMTSRQGTPQRVVFGTFDPAADMDVTQRNLPHWFQPGAATFVTFRTLDSLPKDVLLRWRCELQAWLAQRNLPPILASSFGQRPVANHEKLLSQLKAADRREWTRMRDQIMHRSLDDCHGACLLRIPRLAKIVAEAMLFQQHVQYDVDRLVVMPNHVHAIVQFRPGVKLLTISQSWLRYTARRINAETGHSGPFWQPEPFDHIIRSPDQFVYLQNYIADNPRKAKLCEGEFLYWQAAYEL